MLALSTGGLVDPLESIRSAAVRECREETGIETEFVALSAFRETQKGPFQTSDMYFIALLRLSDKYAEDGQSRPEPNPDPNEIAACSWIPVEEFLGSKWYRNSMYGNLLKAAFRFGIAPPIRFWGLCIDASPHVLHHHISVIVLFILKVVQGRCRLRSCRGVSTRFGDNGYVASAQSS